MFYLPGVCTHTDTEGKQRKARVRNILKFLRKNTIFNEHPVFVVCNAKGVDAARVQEEQASGQSSKARVFCEQGREL